MAEKEAERKIPFPLCNKQIKAAQVVVIDDQKQKQGPLPLKEALRLAEDVGLDLIQTKSGKVPICKIQSFGTVEAQILDARKKMARTINNKMDKATAGDVVTPKSKKMKTITFSSRTERNDMKRHTINAIKFLEKGYKVKVECVEKQRGFGKNRQPGIEQNIHLVEYFEESLKDVAEIKNMQTLKNPERKVFELVMLNSYAKKLQAEQSADLEQKIFEEEHDLR